jgi:hypothetical protein
MTEDHAPHPRRRLPRIPLLATVSIALTLGAAGYALGHTQSGTKEPTSACEAAQAALHEQLATVDPEDTMAARTVAHLVVGNASCFDPATVAEMQAVLDRLR